MKLERSIIISDKAINITAVILKGMDFLHPLLVESLHFMECG